MGAADKFNPNEPTKEDIEELAVITGCLLNRLQIYELTFGLHSPTCDVFYSRFSAIYDMLDKYKAGRLGMLDIGVHIKEALDLVPPVEVYAARIIQNIKSGDSLTKPNITSGITKSQFVDEANEQNAYLIVLDYMLHTICNFYEDIKHRVRDPSVPLQNIPAPVDEMLKDILHENRYDWSLDDLLNAITTIMLIIRHYEF